MFFGMDWFDGLNHSIAALSTGGFSTKAESIGYYDSLGIELVTIVLMLLGCTNFLAHLFLIRGKLKTFFRYCEVRFMLMICGFFTPVMAVLLLYAGPVSYTHLLPWLGSGMQIPGTYLPYQSSSGSPYCSATLPRQSQKAGARPRQMR